MTEEVAQSRVDIVKIQNVVTEGNLLGTRTLFEEGDDAFQRRTDLTDADHSVCVLVQRGSFSFEGE